MEEHLDDDIYSDLLRVHEGSAWMDVFQIQVSLRDKVIRGIKSTERHLLFAVD